MADDTDNLSAGRWSSKLEASICIEITGADASRVLNNLCTADVAKLPTGQCCEAFVTDIRGRVVAHVLCEKVQGGVRVVGQHLDSQAVAAHIYRYIIREDAVVADRSSEVALFAVSDTSPLETVATEEATVEPPFRRVSAFESMSSVLPVMIVGSGSGIVCCAEEMAGELADHLGRLGFAAANREQFELARIRSFWPMSGREIQEKTLPQELDRDSVAISFTKGCYLGQETVARLDARGQLQKKLCLIEIDGHVGESPELTDTDAVVGKIYSSAFDSAAGNTFALANMRRGFFEPGVQVHLGDVGAVVLSPDLAQR